MTVAHVEKLSINFQYKGHLIDASPITLKTRLIGDQDAWRFNLNIPDKGMTIITISGYISSNPDVTLKQVIDSFLESEKP